MKTEQKIKILKVSAIATLIMLVFEIIFSLQVVNDFFYNEILKANEVMVYLIIWTIMFLQVTILNIPASVVISASITVGIDCLTWKYILVVMSAYMCGCVLAYGLGKWFGTRAIKWCAGSEEDYEKWVVALNTKGKWWYLASVVFPLFPDDLLCIVAGSVHFNFGFYFISNLIGRSIGLVSLIFTFQLIGESNSHFNMLIIVWAVALLVELIAIIILKKSSLTNKK